MPFQLLRISVMTLAGLSFWLAARESAAEAEKKEVPVPVLAMIENSQRLRSGQYQAKGTLKLSKFRWYNGRRVDQETTDTFDESFESDFDLDQDLFSFRRVRTREGGSRKNLSNGVQRRWYLNIPGLTVTLRGGDFETWVTLHQPTPWKEIWNYGHSSLDPPQPIIDPRAFGWGGMHGLGMAFEELSRFASENKHDEQKIINDGNGIERIETVRNRERNFFVQLTHWYDQNQGGRLVRYAAKSTVKPPGRSVEEVFRDREPTEEGSFSWERHGDVWVIKTLNMVDSSGERIGDLQLTFNWQNVNQPIPADRFDWKQWQRGKEYKSLYDERQGKGHAMRDSVTRGIPHEIDLQGSFTVPDPEKNQARYWLFFANIVVLCLAAGWFSRRLIRG